MSPAELNVWVTEVGEHCEIGLQRLPPPPNRLTDATAQPVRRADDA